MICNNGEISRYFAKQKIRIISLFRKPLVIECQPIGSQIHVDETQLVKGGPRPPRFFFFTSLITVHSPGSLVTTAMLQGIPQSEIKVRVRSISANSR